MSLKANHFEVFDLPITFEIDDQILAQRYRELQRTVHPDNYAQASERERRLAMQKSTQVNEAFQTLKNPLARGHYLLQLQGIDTNAASDTMIDPEFLMMQMELREELATIKRQPQPLEALNRLLQRLEQQIQQLTITLSQQLTQQNWSAAHDSVRQWQFFQRLHEETLRLEEELI
jgi:molecular chaperone HscB